MLPVEAIWAELSARINQQDVILTAPPGAGKSTWLPLQLLKLNSLAGSKIIMLQPRRIAARAIATYLAEQLGESVGQTVGYRIRGEAKVSKNTRLEIVTEGLLARTIQSDPELTGVGLVIFDEFHERNIHGDFALALALEVQQGLRDDLRILVMSATLETDGVQQLLPGAATIQSEGRSYPIDTHYAPLKQQQPMPQQICQVVLQALSQHSGSALVFLPGARMIEQCQQLLQQSCDASVQIHTLYGRLSKEQQLQAIAPAPDGKRKVVLATNIAETSLTIDGINMVIDSGLENNAVFNLNNGVTQLQQQRISRASATQRAGRAGRLGPGVCYRLWSQEQQGFLAPQSQPEILQADIASLLLDTLAWGTEITDLPLLDQPTDAQVQQARALLFELGALDESNKLTPHGRNLSALGTHPRIASMLLHAKAMDEHSHSLACAIAALLEEKDILTGRQGVSLDLRLNYLLQNKNHPSWQAIRQWHKRQGVALSHSWPLSMAGVILALSCPDRIARQRQQGSYQLVNGGGASLSFDDKLFGNEWLVAADLFMTPKQQGDAAISLAAEISLTELETHFAHMFAEKEQCQWQAKEQRIEARLQRLLGAIVVHQRPTGNIPEPQRLDIWQQVLAEKPFAQWPLSVTCHNWLQRARLAGQHLPDWPDFSEAWLQQHIDDWLWPYMDGITSWKQFEKLDFLNILKNRLSWPQQQQMQQELPEKIEVPSGSNYSLRYEPDGSVVLSVRMQEMYGMAQNPSIANGQIPLLVELLSPAQRPIQLTRDLVGFWQGSYKEVQKEMKGRYPKHFWPDDPATAQATRVTKNKMKQQEQ